MYKIYTYSPYILYILNQKYIAIIKYIIHVPIVYYNLQVHLIPQIVPSLKKMLTEFQFFVF